MEKKPNIYKPTIGNVLNNNRKVYYSYIDNEGDLNVEKNREDPIKSLSNLINDGGYIFNKNVIIKTKDNVFDTRIAGKIGEKIVTISGESINIKNILEISEK